MGAKVGQPADMDTRTHVELLLGRHRSSSTTALCR
jgi:hypothetical protein